MPTSPRSWLLLLPEIAGGHSSLRVRVWRRLREIGAVRLSTGAHLLPDGDDEREDFDWLLQEIRRGGGKAVVARISTLSGISDTEAIELFRRARDEDYREWSLELRAIRNALRAGSVREKREELATLRRHLMDIEKIDRFPGSSRESARRALASLEKSLTRAPAVAPKVGSRFDRRAYRNRAWATRPDPKSDRLACAWLVLRFIDPKARFRFATDPAAVRGAVAFDAPGAPFTHEGEDCTFEVLVRRFGIKDAGAAFVAEVIHDIDVKDGKFGNPATPGFARLLEGLRAVEKDDARRLQRGLSLFDLLAASGGAAPRRL